MLSLRMLRAALVGIVHLALILTPNSSVLGAPLTRKWRGVGAPLGCPSNWVQGLEFRAPPYAVSNRSRPSVREWLQIEYLVTKLPSAPVCC